MPLYNPSSSGGGASLASSISDGDTTHAPDGNSVFDALALKSATNHTHVLASGATDVTATAAEVNALHGVKRYVALLTQSGTDAPVASVLENSLGAAMVWSRVAAGNYEGVVETSPGAGVGPLTLGKTGTLLAQNNNGFQFEFAPGGSNTTTLSLNSYRIVIDGTDIVGEAVDSAILNMMCEVVVYP